MQKTVHGKALPHAEVTLPSSKSLSHRALITAALAEGTSRIRSLTESKDTQATVRALQAAGAVFDRDGDDIIVHGIGGRITSDGGVVDCGESGSTLRFLIPIFATAEGIFRFTGHGKLMERPQTVYEELFKERSLQFAKEGEVLQVEGALCSGTYRVNGNISSQFISGLLFALPMLEGDSTIEIVPPYESASYVGLTVDALKRAGIAVEEDGLTYRIPGGQKYQPIDCTVEGDDSQSAFFAELAMVSGTSVTVHNLNHHSRQGDRVIRDMIAKMGGIVAETEDGYCFSADTLHGTELDLGDCPDLGPALFALATQAEGTTVFANTRRLRIKESDRVGCMEEELHRLGCDMTSDENSVTISGRTKIKGGVTVYGHNDHRIVMALACLAAAAEEPVTIEEAQAITKSYPGFFEDLAATGVIIA